MRKLVSVMMMLLLVTGLSFNLVFPVKAATSVYIANPDTGDNNFIFYVNTTSEGSRFNATVWVEDLATPVFAFQVNMVTNPPGDWLNITNAWLPASDPAYIFSGQSTVMPPPAFYDNNGDGCNDGVKIGDSILVGNAVSGAGPFKLATIELQLVKAPGKFETFNADLNIDNVDTYLLDEALDTITQIATDGSVTYDWQPPTTNPHMGVMPDYMLFDQYNNWLDPPNSDFTIDVRIENLDTGWALHNASFRLSYNTPDPILSLLSVVVDASWTGLNIVDISTPGMIDIFVQGHPSPSGDVLVATITFRIIHQGTNPPQPVSNLTDLTFSDVELWDSVDTIPTEPAEDGVVEVEPILGGVYHWFEVASVTLGPELVVGDQYTKEFDITIDIRDLHFKWKMVGFNIRLCYDPEILEVVSVTEGPFMQDPTWNWYGTYQIVYYPEPPTPWCPHIHLLLADMILPNPSTGEWDQPEPIGDGNVFIIRFKPLVQSWTDTYVVNFTVYPAFPGEYMADEYSDSIPVNEYRIVNGSCTILPIDPIGRRIDIWFLNPPNGGQGIHEPAGLVLPQTEINLTAKVTYNWSPVQYKKVTFEVHDNNGDLWAILQNDTDEDGHAYVTFRMPWPCEGADSLLGKWNVTVSVTLADVVVTDWVIYDYDYLIHIWEVTTDKSEYRHCEYVEITVEFGTKAMREEGVTLAVTVTDELGVPIGIVLVELTVGGAKFCTYKNYTVTVTMYIDKFACAGLATVYVSFLSALPSEGGEAVAQEVTATFYILPI